MFLILTLIVLVAALNIISGLTMLVKDKGHDIAILRTMGATRGAIMRVFFITGASIGTVGTLAGFILGVVVSLNIESIRQFISWLTRTELFSPELYFLSQLPADMDAARDDHGDRHGAGAVVSSRRSTRPGGRRASIRSRRCATNERRRRSSGRPARRPVLRLVGVERHYQRRRRRADRARRRQPRRSIPARWWRWSRRPAPASRRSSTSPACSSSPTAARCSSPASRPASSPISERTAHPPPADRLRLPVPPPAAGIHGAGKHHDAAAHPRHRPRARRCSARCSSSPICGSRSARRTGRPSCPAASSSGWRSPAPSPTRRGCCSPTSRPATSTRPPPAFVFDGLIAAGARLEARRLIATHNHDLAARMDRVITLDEGKVVELRTPADARGRHGPSRCAPREPARVSSVGGAVAPSCAGSDAGARHAACD